MKRSRGFACAAMALTLAFSAAAFAACGGDGEDGKEVYEEDNVVPIAIEDNYAAEKVTTQGFAVGTATEEKGAFTLPKLVGDNMLLQANVVNRVWGGTAEEGAIAAQILKKDGTAEATYYGTVKDGAFEIWLGAHDYGSGYGLRLITESGKSVTLQNVAFGELWIGGGQSNMGWEMGQCYRGNTSRLLYQKEIAASANENIRLFRVYNSASEQKVGDVENATGWKQAEPDSVKAFSAAGYFFAKELNAQYNVPVGIVMSCMGGTGINCWLPEEDIPNAAGSVNPDLTHEELLEDSNPNNDNNYNSGYFNGMIYPLRNLTVRGVLWYQGEGDYNSYDVNYALLMKSWRRVFGRDNMWFTTVTLPRYPDADAYFACREQQKAASVNDPYATYSVNIDCGLLPKDVAEGDTLNPQGIHPYDKKPIGERAAHVTMRDLYGAKGVWSGPVLKSAKVSGNKVIVTFSNVGKGLALQGKFGFELADRSNPKLLRNASVRILSDNQIEVSSDQVSNPVKIVYGRANDDLDAIESYADCVCLYNTKGATDEVAYPAEQFEYSF